MALMDVEQSSLTDIQKELLVQKIEGRLKRVFTTPEFDDPTQSRIIVGVMPGYESYLEQVRQVRSQNNKSMPEHLRVCYEEPLLSKEQEQHLFRRYNYHKFLAQKWLQIDRIPKACSELKKSDEVRKQITTANVRLAIPVVRRFQSVRHHEDLVGESYYLIHRAVDYFDYTRGLKFSTYATWAVSNTMGRLAKDLFKHDSLHNGQIDNIASSLVTDGEEEKITQSQDHFKSLVNKLLVFAQDREREVLVRRFFKNETLEAIGNDIQVTKERVRQIELAAIRRLSGKAQELGYCIENVF